MNSPTFSHNSPLFGEFSIYVADIKKPDKVQKFSGSTLYVYTGSVQGTPLCECLVLVGIVTSDPLYNLDPVNFTTYVVYEYVQGVAAAKQMPSILEHFNTHLQNCYVNESDQKVREEMSDGTHAARMLS